MKKEKGPSILCWAFLLFSGTIIYGKISITITPSSLSLQLKSGVFYNSQIQVLNDGDVDYEVNVSFHDLGQNKNGEIFSQDPGILERGAGKWFSSDYNSFILKKGEKKFFKYYIDVPVLANGSYAGAILFTVQTPKTAQEFGASISAGIASKIFITVSEMAETDYIFKDFKSIMDEKGNYYFLLSLENPNEIFSYFSGKIFLKDEKGETIYENKIESDKPFFPKTNLELVYKLPEIKEGKYTGILLMNRKGKDPLIKTIRFKVGEDER